MLPDLGYWGTIIYYIVGIVTLGCIVAMIIITGFHEAGPSSPSQSEEK